MTESRKIINVKGLLMHTQSLFNILFYLYEKNQNIFTW